MKLYASTMAQRMIAYKFWNSMLLKIVMPTFSAKNGCVGSARNLGLKYAAGDHVWFIDSDDFIAPNCLSTILKNAARRIVNGWWLGHINSLMMQKHG